MEKILVEELENYRGKDSDSNRLINLGKDYFLNVKVQNSLIEYFKDLIIKERFYDFSIYFKTSCLLTVLSKLFFNNNHKMGNYLGNSYTFIFVNSYLTNFNLIANDPKLRIYTIIIKTYSEPNYLLKDINDEIPNFEIYLSLILKMRSLEFDENCFLGRKNFPRDILEIVKDFLYI